MDDVARIRRNLPDTHRYITGAHGKHSMTDYDEVGDEYRGPHPVHGSDNWPDGQGNFAVNTKTGTWYCFRQSHKVGGNIFEWIAVDEGLVDCGQADDIATVFPDVLQLAAEEAGVEYNPDPEERKEARERREEAGEIQDVFEAATEFYHDNLPHEKRRHIREKWGLSDYTIDTVKLGYASPDDTELQAALSFNDKQLLQTGLVLSTGDGLKDFYSGRIIFPYWARGKPQYFIGRKTDDTPDESWEHGKYKKLLTSDNKDHVSDLVDEPIFGRDSALGAERVVVTEGVTDVLAAWEAGYAAISPVTTEFKKARVREAADLVNGKTACVVMDEDPDSEAGRTGGAKTVRALLQYTGGHTNVGMWRLAEDGVEDGDLCDYLYDHEPASPDTVRQVSGLNRGDAE